MTQARALFPLRWETLFRLCLGLRLVLSGLGASEVPRATLPADDLFASPGVWNLEVDVAPTQWEALKHNRNSHTYVRAIVREGGKSLKDVGIHCKGNPAKEIASGKPDFTVTFDKFVSGQTFHGHKRVILQSGRDDPSFLGAPIAFEMFRNAGLPSPRCAFARLRLNGRDVGLYQVIEGVNRDFLRRTFPQGDGNLYDEGDHTDVDGKLEKLGSAHESDQPDVDALAAAALVTDPAQRWKRMGQLLDMDRFLAFTALEVLWWPKDSYGIHGRKFHIYHDPATNRMIFFPKGIEGVLLKTDGPVMPEFKGLVARAVLGTPEGQQQYRKTVARLMDTLFTAEKVRARGRELAALIRSAVAGDDADAAKAFDAAVAGFYDAGARRAQFVSSQLK